MATPDMSKFTIEELVYDAGHPFQAFTAEESIAELTRRMTPPPGCVRIGDRDTKYLGRMPMSGDGVWFGPGAHFWVFDEGAFVECGVLSISNPDDRHEEDYEPEKRWKVYVRDINGNDFKAWNGDLFTSKEACEAAEAARGKQ